MAKQILANFKIPQQNTPTTIIQKKNELIFTHTHKKKKHGRKGGVGLEAARAINHSNSPGGQDYVVEGVPPPKKAPK